MAHYCIIAYIDRYRGTEEVAEEILDGTPEERIDWVEKNYGLGATIEESHDLDKELEG